jgi:hypothetical protein
MKQHERRDLIRAQRMMCAWCAIPISLGAEVVERPKGPLAFCDTCTDRYRDRDAHPYLHRCLEAQGR